MGRKNEGQRWKGVVRDEGDSNVRGEKREGVDLREQVEDW